MRNERAYRAGAEASLSKFAIDASTLRKMMNVYSYMPAERFDSMLKNRMALDNKRLGAPIMNPGVMTQAQPPMQVPVVAPEGPVVAPIGAMDKTVAGRGLNAAPPRVAAKATPTITAPSFVMPKR